MTSRLEEVLADARSVGFLGPAPIAVGVAHARGFMVEIPAPERLVDLGSGGGLPGLVLADCWPKAQVFLVESNQQRCQFLAEAVERLGFGDRVVVLQERAETTGRRPELRGTIDLVVARGFGPPAVTAECGAPLLGVGGRLVVSEPPAEVPGEAPRWPSEALAELGLAPDRVWATEFHYRSLAQVRPCPERYPRRVGIPAKRPLY
ncbi:MAG TPA: RsmG family class I SAM-dependent methyltransferase [Acidimicrobiales bacterium]